MTDARVLFYTLSVRKSKADREYLLGWLGACELIGFPGEPDGFGNPTWRLFMKEREERPPRDDERVVAELVPS